MRKRSQTHCCRPVSVRPSVRLSVTLVHYIHTAEVIVKLLCWPGNPIILVFRPHRRYQISRGTPSAGAQNTRAVGKFRDFRLKSMSISEMMGLSDGRKSFHICLDILIQYRRVTDTQLPSQPDTLPSQGHRLLRRAGKNHFACIL